MYLNLFLEKGDLVGLIIAIVLTSAILVLALIAVIVAIVKNTKKANQRKKIIESEGKNLELIEAFGEANIKDVEMEMSRITITVKNIEIVNADRIKELGASGVLLVGDKVKCSFKENVEEIYNELKGAISNE
ncbi:MAG: PTS transporter subunit EIIB [Bacilli bacterium]|nr:PTS transporter subunit EIIB [Bacilli bacterium]